LPTKRRQPPTPLPPTRTPLVDYVAVGVVALCLRAVHALALWSGDVGDNLYLNAARYDAWARMILDGVGPTPPWEQAPGYAYLLSILYAVADSGAGAAIAFQVCLGTASCLLLQTVTARFAHRRAALATGLLAAAYGPFIYFSAELLPETVFVFLCVATLATATTPAQSIASWTLTGSLWGAAYLVRTNALLGVPFALLHAWQCGGRRAALGVALPVLVALLGLFSVNGTAGGERVWSTTSGGVNFWLGNNPAADGVSPFFGPDHMETDTEVRQRARTAAEADRIFAAYARQHWREQPGMLFALAGKKLLWTFSDRELPNNVDIEWRRSRSPIFAMPGFPLGFAAIFILALTAFAGGRVVGRGDAWAFTAPVAIAVGTCVIFFTNARFRLPLAIPLLIFAGVAIDQMWNLARQGLHARRTVLRVVALALVATIIGVGNWFGVRDYRIAQIDVNTGIAERDAGRFATAIEFLQRGLQSEPRDAIGWVHLALALEQYGEIEAARRAYAEARMHTPEDPDLRTMQERFEARQRAGR